MARGLRAKHALECGDLSPLLSLASTRLRPQSGVMPPSASHFSAIPASDQTRQDVYKVQAMVPLWGFARSQKRRDSAALPSASLVRGMNLDFQSLVVFSNLRSPFE